MEYRKPTQHRMTRRSASHDYSRPGIYHITLHVADGLGHPLGSVVGSLDAPEGTPEAPHVVLTPIGQMVEHELLTAITAHYPMVSVQDYAIMPEHIHFLLVVQDKILSSNGTTQPIGQVIAGFKQGCNRQFWAMAQRAEPVGTLTAPAAAAAPAPAACAPASAPAPAAGAPAAPAPAACAPVAAPAAAAAGATVSVPGGLAAGKALPLFAPGYCDVMPVDAAQLDTQRAYIQGNPRSRLLRTQHRDWLMPQRAPFVTALTVRALMGYLRRECLPSQATPDALSLIERRLLLAGDSIACHTYGDRSLLERRLLPVVCHRNDRPLFELQKARCLEAAAQGAVLVSPRIAKGEQVIIDEALRLGAAVVLLHDNGFADRYHPSVSQLDRCAAGRLLIVTPWHYEFRQKDDTVTVAQCKAMNCVAQALCRQKDSWWRAPNSNPSI